MYFDLWYVLRQLIANRFSEGPLQYLYSFALQPSIILTTFTIINLQLVRWYSAECVTWRGLQGDELTYQLFKKIYINNSYFESKVRLKKLYWVPWFVHTVIVTNLVSQSARFPDKNVCCNLKCGKISVLFPWAVSLSGIILKPQGQQFPQLYHWISSLLVSCASQNLLNDRNSCEFHKAAFWVFLFNLCAFRCYGVNL